MLGFRGWIWEWSESKQDIFTEVQLHKTLLARSERKIPQHLNQRKSSESECRPGRQWENTPGEKKGKPTFPERSLGKVPSHQRPYLGERPYKLSEIRQKLWSKLPTYASQASHQVENPYKCADCGKKLQVGALASLDTGGSTLERNLTNVLTVGKVSVTAQNFITHRRIHTGESHGVVSVEALQSRLKPYHPENPHRRKALSVWRVRKSFNNSSHFSAHRRIHRREAPCVPTVGRASAGFWLTCTPQNPHWRETYGCQDWQCFSKSSALNKHREIHTHEKNFCHSQHLSKPLRIYEKISLITCIEIVWK